MNDDVFGGCTGKEAYPDRGAALARVRRMKINRRSGRGRTEPYRCPRCRSWHIGSNAL